MFSLREGAEEVLNCCCAVGTVTTLAESEPFVMSEAVARLTCGASSATSIINPHYSSVWRVCRLGIVKGVYLYWFTPLRLYSLGAGGVTLTASYSLTRPFIR